MFSALFFAFASVLATLAGGLLVLRAGWTRDRLWRFLAFGSGILLGMTFLHLLPEAWEGGPKWAGGAVLLAFFLLYGMDEFLVVHACGEAMEEGHHAAGFGALGGLFLHSFADGLAMAFSFMASHGLGMAVSAALAVHKFSDGITLSSLLAGSGFSRGRVWGLNAVLAAATPLGVAAGYVFRPWIGPTALTVLLGLAAGGFLFVSVADILPRLHRNRDPWCWIFLLAGMALSGLMPHP